MNLDQLLQVGVYLGDLVQVDKHFTEIGIPDHNGMLQLKAALIALANVEDFELTIRHTYKVQPEPSRIYRQLSKKLKFAKYLRNNVVGHVHPQLISKAIEWQPVLRRAPGHLENPSFVLQLNLWLFEVAINT
jgi:hypothetical protein